MDTLKKTVTAKVMHFSRFAIFPAAPLSNKDFWPKQRIITPARIDGRNDTADFNALDPTQDYEIKIFDLNGRKIRSILNPLTKWDGKNDGGDVVESGVYIYQFKADVNDKKQLISGTITVAK